MVMFPGFAPDWEEMRHQILSFPAGKNDDVVDALSKIGQYLDKMVPANVVAKETFDGYIPPQRLTCGWIAKSHKQQERSRRLSMAE
jgi:hypothetical protein